MDGVTKELAEYFEKLEKLGDMAVEAVKEQIDIEADRAEQEIQDNTPQGKTGGLVRSLKKKDRHAEKIRILARIRGRK